MEERTNNLTFPTNFSTFTETNNCLVEFDGSTSMENLPVSMLHNVVNILSIPVATMANFFVLWAIKERPSLHTPSSVFLFILALSDFAIGVFVQPLVVIRSFGAAAHNYRLSCISNVLIFAVGTALASMSFACITEISFDRYLALVLHLRYNSIITVRRVIKYKIIASVAIFPISIYFWFSKEEWFKRTVLTVAITLAAICVTLIPISYYKIFMILRRHKRQIRNQNNVATCTQGFSDTDLSKYRKSVLAILYVLGAVALSYIPLGVCTWMQIVFQTKINQLVTSSAGLLVLLNSSINPLVYCWRMTEIRRFVVMKLRSILGVDRGRQVRSVGVMTR